jgi:hypothetical protein
VLPGGRVGVFMYIYCKADGIDEISNFHNLVHFIPKCVGDALFVISFFDRPNPPQKHMESSSSK